MKLLPLIYAEQAEIWQCILIRWSHIQFKRLAFWIKVTAELSEHYLMAQALIEVAATNSSIPMLR